MPCEQYQRYHWPGVPGSSPTTGHLRRGGGGGGGGGGGVEVAPQEGALHLPQVAAHVPHVPIPDRVPLFKPQRCIIWFSDQIYGYS